jgi:hypothetical protein
MRIALHQSVTSRKKLERENPNSKEIAMCKGVLLGDIKCEGVLLGDVNCEGFLLAGAK